jgi:hypothetical protein
MDTGGVSFSGQALASGQGRGKWPGESERRELMPGSQGEGPKFQPERGWLDALGDVIESIAGLLRSLSFLASTFRELEPADRRAAGAGFTGAVGAVGTTVAGLLHAAPAPFWAYVLTGLSFQIFWVRRAIPAVRADSGRLKAIYNGQKDELALEEHFKKTREWRHAWASSLVGSLKAPLEHCALVADAMGRAVEQVVELTGYPLALVLVRRQGDCYEIVLTKGEVSDCLKAGTKWLHRDMNVYEYVGRRSLYPHHLIEREVLGNAEYFLIAASEIDVVGKVKETVLDCFVDVVRHGIGRVVAHGDAEPEVKQ